MVGKKGYFFQTPMQPEKKSTRLAPTRQEKNFGMETGMGDALGCLLSIRENGLFCTGWDAPT